MYWQRTVTKCISPSQPDWATCWAVSEQEKVTQMKTIAFDTWTKRFPAHLPAVIWVERYAPHHKRNNRHEKRRKKKQSLVCRHIQTQNLSPGYDVYTRRGLTDWTNACHFDTSKTQLQDMMARPASTCTGLNLYRFKTSENSESSYSVHCFPFFVTTWLWFCIHFWALKNGHRTCLLYNLKCLI